MDEAPASICGQSPGEVLGFLRTAFSVYNNCRVVAYNGSTSVLHHSASSEPVPGSHARLMAQLMEVVKHFLRAKIHDRGGCLILIGSGPELAQAAAAARKAKCVVKYLYNGREQCIPGLAQLAQWSCNWSTWLQRLSRTQLPIAPATAFKNGDMAHALESSKWGQQGSLGSSPRSATGPVLGDLQQRMGPGPTTATSSLAGSSDSAGSRASTAKDAAKDTISGFLDDPSRQTVQMGSGVRMPDESLTTGFEPPSLPTLCAACRMAPLRLESNEGEVMAAYMAGFPKGSNLQRAEGLARELLADCKEDVIAATALYCTDRRPFVTLSFSRPEAANFALQLFNSANDLLSICAWRVWRPARCEECTFNQQATLARALQSAKSVPARPATPDLPRTAANRLVDGKPSGIDLDPLAFADNGAEWRLLQAYIMHAMFDDSGHLLPLWPELDHLLQLQAASGEKLVTRDAVLGMSVHDEGALVAQSARDELESAFVSLARLASSKVDLDLFRGIFSPAQLNYVSHYCQAAITDMIRRFGVHIYITPSCLRAYGKLMRIQVVLPHIRGTIEDLHVGEVAFSMPLAKHLPPTLVDDQTALHLKQIISHFFQDQEALLQTMYKIKLFTDMQPSGEALVHVHVMAAHPPSLAKVAARIKETVEAWSTCVTAIAAGEAAQISRTIASQAASRRDVLATLTSSNQLLVSGRSAELVLASQRKLMQGTSSGRLLHGP
ncbi:hypothetical protein WJX84_008019 [Apatococcus fuscideae]|uniref:Uncharacterized protein n=1 Tax=Apatococcus fuscideae TaxID=2026836 RepID=A0AAW1T579_9CHLO